MRLAPRNCGKGWLTRALYAMAVGSLTVSIVDVTQAQLAPVPPVPVGGDQLKEDQTQILTLVDSFFKGIQNRDSKAVVSCFVGRLPDYYQNLISQDFKLDPSSTTPTIDLILHKGLTGKMYPVVAKSPTLADFVQNSFSKVSGLNEGAPALPRPSDLLGDVEVNGDSAVAPLKAANKHFPIEFVFSRERGQWKIDPFPLFANLQLILAFDQMKNNRTADQESDIYVKQIPDFANQARQPMAPGADDAGLETGAKPLVPATSPSAVISATPTATPGGK